MNCRITSRLRCPSIAAPARWFGTALLLATCLCFAPHTWAGTILIDDFSKPNPSQFFVVGSGTNPTKQMTQMSPGALGGQRDTLISVVGKAQPNSVVGLLGFDNSYQLNAMQIGTNGAAPTVVTLQYSGIHNLNTPTSLVNGHQLGAGAGIDLTGGGTNNRFVASFITNDSQPTIGLDMSITITSPGGKSSTVKATAGNSMSGFNVFFPFNQLVGNAVLTQVDSILFKFNADHLTPNIDYEVKGLAAVPEPNGIVLVSAAFGLFTLSVFGRGAAKPVAAILQCEFFAAAVSL